MLYKYTNSKFIMMVDDEIEQHGVDFDSLITNLDKLMDTLEEKNVRKEYTPEIVSAYMQLVQATRQPATAYNVVVKSVEDAAGMVA